jgi:hypothetical protein
MEVHGDDDDHASWKRLLTRPPELSGSSRDIWERVVGMEEGVRILLISI